MKKTVLIFLTFFLYSATQCVFPLVTSIHNRSAIAYTIYTSKMQKVSQVPVYSYKQYNIPLCGASEVVKMIPSEYWSVKQRKFFPLRTIENSSMNNDCLKQAFEAWKKDFPQQASKYKNPDIWFDQWIGGVVYIKQHQEILGYVHSIAQIVAVNITECALAYAHWSRGLFSKLGLQLDIIQPARGNLQIHLHSHIHEGVIPAVSLLAQKGRASEN